jgi:hypothetical protein
MRTTTARAAAAVAAGLLTLGWATPPASALRLVPVDSAATADDAVSRDEASLLLTLGRVAPHSELPTGPAPQLLLSSGRLPH